MIILGIAVALFVLLAIVEVLDHSSPMYLASKKLPGPGIHFPFIGNCYYIGLMTAASRFKRLREMAKEFPRGYSYYYYKSLFYIVHNAEAFEEVLTLTNTKKGFLYEFMHPFIGQGILTSHSAKWFERRRLITPAFHFKILRQFFQSFRTHSENLVEDIKLKTNKQIDVHKLFASFSLKLICETSIGVPVDDASDYHKSLSKFGDYVQHRMFAIWAHPDVLYRWLGYARPINECAKRLHEYTRQLIKKRRQDFKLDAHNARINCDDNDEVIGYKKNQSALLDTLLAAQIEQGNITDEGIQEEVDTFVFTGHDTIASGMTYTMLCLAEHPDVQQKLYEEIESIVPGDQILTINHINSCTYLDMVIKESLRLLPPVPIMIREILDETKINGVTMPVGTEILLYTIDLHRDPRWFPDPLKFIPERFLPENVENRHRFAYVPFSAGVRNCIGQKYALMEMKTMIIKVLKAYQMEAVTKIRDLVFVVDMVLHTNHPVEIRFTNRKKTQ